MTELAARIRQDAATCGFASIKDPQDEALRSRFICSVNNEAVLKALFKVKDDKLDFARAIEIATETEDAAEVAKDTVHGARPKSVHRVALRPPNKFACYRCGVETHQAPQCRFKDSECHFCGIKGHISKVCRKKNSATSKSSKTPVKLIHEIKAVNEKSLRKLEAPIKTQGRTCTMELDSATNGNFISKQTWKDLGSPKLQKPDLHYESASKHGLPIIGCLKDNELEVKFKPNAQPIFRKARPVPFAMEADLEEEYQKGETKQVWEATQFCQFGTPVVPIKKAVLPGQKKPKIRVCGDYSFTVNHQLEDHQHPLPLPEDLMRRLGEGYGFTKIDLADAFNQIKLAPESQRRIALSTHKGVFLQKRLPFGIKSAPRYFQQIMDKLTIDLPGVATYLDDILVSGIDAEDHLSNLQRLLQRLQDKEHTAQGKQAREATKSQQKEIISKVVRSYKVGDPVYALYLGPRRDAEGRWVPAIIIKRKGSRSFNVHVQPKGPTWRRSRSSSFAVYRESKFTSD
eukprot:gene15029-biopygen4633